MQKMTVKENKKYEQIFKDNFIRNMIFEKKETKY